MQVVVIGTGTVGKAVTCTLRRHGHDVVSVERNSGDLQADITDIRTLNNLFNRGGPEPPRRVRRLPGVRTQPAAGLRY
jgi:2-polyprenyl-6-methoxyphenol hydroxylase-like FAD-dependent oxidoreductase